MLIRALIPLLLLVPLAVQAGGTVTLELRNSAREQSTFEYLDEHTARLEASGHNYLLVRDDKAYMVSVDGDRHVVMDLAEMAAMSRQMGHVYGQAPQPPLAAEHAADFERLEKTGRRETVAGIEGDVYRLQWRTDDRLKTEELVLSDDPRAVAFTEAFMNAVQVMARASGSEQAMANTGGTRGLFARLERDRLGVLRFGSDMTVTSFREGAARSRFDLPAPVTSMQEMMGGGMGGGSGASGMFGGLFGKAAGKATEKAERQKQRQERRVESKADRAIDRSVDKAVDSLLKGLFK
jgi:hypothetical protein